MENKSVKWLEGFIEGFMLRARQHWKNEGEAVEELIEALGKEKRRAGKKREQGTP
jgi:hypothetical protein